MRTAGVGYGRGRALAVPGQQLRALGAGQQVNTGQRPRGIGGDRGEHRHQVPGQPADRGRVEQRGGVLEAAGQAAVARLAHRERQVELDRERAGLRVLARRRRLADVPGVLRTALPAQAGRGPAAGAAGRVAEEHLEQRRARPVPIGDELLDEVLERQVLVRVRAERHGPHPGQDLGERRVPGQVCAHHERVDEEPDQTLGLAAVTAGHRAADHHVVEAGVPAEQDHVRGQQRHERRRAALAGQVAQPLGHLSGHAEAQLRAGGRPYRRTRPVGGQLHDGRARQLLAPVAELRLEHVTGQPSALPHREVRVLHRQRRQRVGPPVAERLVQGRQLAAEDRPRPLVEDHMMHGQGQHVVGGAEPQQARPHQRLRAEVERRRRVRGHECPCGGAGIRARGHVGDPERSGRRLVDHLVRDTVPAGDQPGPQHLVPLEQSAERPLERRDVEVARQRHRR